MPPGTAQHPLFPAAKPPFGGRFALSPTLQPFFTRRGGQPRWGAQPGGPPGGMLEARGGDNGRAASRTRTDGGLGRKGGGGQPESTEGGSTTRGERRGCLASPGQSGASPAAALPPPSPGRDPPPAAWGEGGAPALTSGEGFIKAAGGEEIPNAGAEPQRSRQRFPAASCPRPPRRRDAVVPPPLRPGPALHRPGPRHRLGRPLGPAAPAVPAEIPGCRRREAGESPPPDGAGTPLETPTAPLLLPLPLPCSPPSPLADHYFPHRRPLHFPAAHPGTLSAFPLFLSRPPRCPRSGPRFPDRPLVPHHRWAMAAGWPGAGWGDPPPAQPAGGRGAAAARTEGRAPGEAPRGFSGVQNQGSCLDAAGRCPLPCNGAARAQRDERKDNRARGCPSPAAFPKTCPVLLQQQPLSILAETTREGRGGRVMLG